MRYAIPWWMCCNGTKLYLKRINILYKVYANYVIVVSHKKNECSYMLPSRQNQIQVLMKYQHLSCLPGDYTWVVTELGEFLMKMFSITEYWYAGTSHQSNSHGINIRYIPYHLCFGGALSYFHWITIFKWFACINWLLLSRVVTLWHWGNHLIAQMKKWLWRMWVKLVGT